MGWFWGDSVTGNVTRIDVPVKEGYVDVGLKSAGSLNLTIPIPAINQAVLSLQQRRGNARPYGGVARTSDTSMGLKSVWRSFIGYEEDGVIIQAGPILSMQIHADSKLVSINAAGALAWLNEQYVLGTGFNPANNYIRGPGTTYTNMSLRTIMKRLVQYAMGNTGASSATLYQPMMPISTPEADASGTHVRTYRPLDTLSVGEALQNLSEVEGGPEFEIRPRFTDDTRSKVTWDLITGAPEISQQVNTIGREDINWFADPFVAYSTPSPVTRHFLTFEQMYPNWNYYKANNIGTYPANDSAKWDMGLKNFDSPTRVQYNGAWQFRFGASGTATGGRTFGIRFADKPDGAIPIENRGVEGTAMSFARLTITLTNSGTAPLEVRYATPTPRYIRPDLTVGAEIATLLGTQRSYGTLAAGQTRTFVMEVGGYSSNWVKKYAWQTRGYETGTYNGWAAGLLFVKNGAAGNWGPVYAKDILLQKTNPQPVNRSAYSSYVGQPTVPFSGATANTSNFQYSWKGTAGRSVSIRRTIAGNALPPIQIDKLGTGGSVVTGLTVSQSYKSIVTDSWQIGAVPEEGKTRAYPNAPADVPYSGRAWAPTDATMPSRMVAESRSTVSVRSTLVSHANKAVKRGARDEWEWRFSIPKDILSYGAVRVGDYLEFKQQFIEEALPLTSASNTPYRVRVIAIQYNFPSNYLDYVCLPDW